MDTRSKSRLVDSSDDTLLIYSRASHDRRSYGFLCDPIFSPKKTKSFDLTKNATQGSINQQIFPLIPAEVLQISQSSVKTRLLRARLKIRDALAPGLDGAWSTGDGSWKKVRPW